MIYLHIKCSYSREEELLLQISKLHNKNKFLLNDLIEVRSEYEKLKDRVALVMAIGIGCLLFQLINKIFS
jgi:hypothetical protein